MRSGSLLGRFVLAGIQSQKRSQCEGAEAESGFHDAFLYAIYKRESLNAVLLSFLWCGREVMKILKTQLFFRLAEASIEGVV